MRTILIAILLALALPFAACGQDKIQNNERIHAKAPMEERLAAVLIYADWCGSCKILDPKIKSVREANDFANTTFITLDYTDKNDEAFFNAADEAGVGSVIRAGLSGGVKTGLLVLVDLDDSKAVGFVTRDMSEEEIAVKILDAEKAA